MASIASLITDLGIKVSVEATNEIEAHCPFHPDRHPSFYINAKTGLWICFQCSASGSLPMLIELVSGKKNVNPDIYLREIRSKDVGKYKAEIVEDPPPEIDPVLVYARYESFRNPPKWALRERMIDSDVAEQYGLKWDHGWIIPIWDPFDKTCLWGWQFKRLDYVSNYPRSIKKSMTLFGLRELYSTKLDVVLVESPLDVARLATAGVPAVASFGAFVSKDQIRLVNEFSRSVILALDADLEGQKQTDKIFPRFAAFTGVTKVTFPEGCKDPGDLSDKQIRMVFR